MTPVTPIKREAQSCEPIKVAWLECLEWADFKVRWKQLQAEGHVSVGRKLWTELVNV